MVLNGGRVTVSFEREHRIASGESDSQTLDVRLKSERLPVPEYELRNNRGFETLALAPLGGPFEGARVAVTEKSLNKNGNIFAAVMEGPKKGIFFIARMASLTSPTATFCRTATCCFWSADSTWRTALPCGCRRSKAATSKPARPSGRNAAGGGFGLPDRQYGSAGCVAGRRRRHRW